MKFAVRMLAVMIAIVPVMAWAQSEQVVAQVPFEFSAGSQIVPAGAYSLRLSGPGLQMAVIQNSDAKVSVYSNVSIAQYHQGGVTNALIFHKYGDRYFLSGVRVANLETTYSLSMGKAEAELRARNVPERDEILLASAR